MDQKLPGPPILSIPAGEVALDLGIHPDRVELLNGKVKVGGSRALANVVIPYGGRAPITIDTTAEPLVLEDVGKLADIPLGGVGAARVSIRIPAGVRLPRRRAGAAGCDVPRLRPGQPLLAGDRSRRRSSPSPMPPG